MKKVSKNNKGFSLVELIVVVLIMAIIAVSLAPQVMKWVDRSRQANDASNYDALVAAAQLSVLAAPAGDGKVLIITMDTANASGEGTSVSWETGNEGTAAAKTAFETAMTNNLPGWKEIAVTSSENASEDYTIKITNATVTKDNAPDEIDAD